MKELLLAIWLVLLSNHAFSQDALPELEIKKIDEGVYLHTSYKEFGSWGVVASNGLIAVNGKSAIVIDTPATESDTQLLLDWLGDNGLKAEAVIATHFHHDSTAGFALLNAQNIPTYATRLTNQLLAKENGAQATQVIKDDSYWLVENKIEAYYPGGGHTKDNIVVWLADKQILFGGCFVKPDHLGYIGDAVLTDWPNSTKNLLSKYTDVKWVVPGHGELGGKLLLEQTLARVIEASDKENSTHH